MSRKENISNLKNREGRDYYSARINGWIYGSYQGGKTVPLQAMWY